MLPETVTPDHPARVSAATGRSWTQVLNAFKNPRLGLVLTIYFLSIVAFSILTAVFTLFMVFRLGYDAFHSGWIFAFVGIISAVIQGALIGKLVKRFGEPWLVIAGTLFFTASLFAIPFIGPCGGSGWHSSDRRHFCGRQRAERSVAYQSRVKERERGEQGVVMGVTQSVASLGRAVGPSIAAFLIYSTVAYVGVDRLPHHMSDSSILRTFWTAGAIQFVAFLFAIYFARVHGRESRRVKLSESRPVGIAGG